MAVTWSWYVHRNREAPVVREELGPPSNVPDEFWQKIIKLIPVETIALYTALVGLAYIPAESVWIWTLVGAFGLGVALTLVALTRGRGLSWGDPQGRAQILIAILAFAVWVFAQGGFFVEWHPFGYVYEPFHGSVIAIVFAAFIPFYNPTPPAS
jgi:hypothetical protein